MTQSIADQLKSVKRRSIQTKEELIIAQRRMAEQQEAKVKCRELKRTLLNKRMKEQSMKELLDFSSIIEDQYDSIYKISCKACSKLSNFNLGITPDDLCHDVITLLLSEAHLPAKSIGSLLYRLINRSLEQYIAKHLIIRYLWAEGKQTKQFIARYSDLEHNPHLVNGASRFDKVLSSEQARKEVIFEVEY